jgi:hypothetical protein
MVAIGHRCEHFDVQGFIGLFLQSLNEGSRSK